MSFQTSFYPGIYGNSVKQRSYEIPRRFILQILGIVMGRNLAPILANIHMAMLEEELYSFKNV